MCCATWNYLKKLLVCCNIAFRFTKNDSEVKTIHDSLIKTSLCKDLIKIFFFSFIFLQVEAGDVILKVNGTDVHRYSTKEGKLSQVFPANFFVAFLLMTSALHTVVLIFNHFLFNFFQFYDVCVLPTIQSH